MPYWERCVWMDGKISNELRVLPKKAEGEEREKNFDTKSKEKIFSHANCLYKKLH